MASNNGYLTHCRICGTPIFSLGNRQFCSACYAQNRRNAAHRSNAEAKMRREQAKREEEKMKASNKTVTSAQELAMRAKLSEMGGIGNGKVLVVIATYGATGDESINDAANEEVIALLSSAAPANDGASLLLDNVPADFDGRTLSLTNERVLVKDGDSEVVFAPASYNADDIQFTDTKQTLSGFTVARSDYADSDSSKTYLVEGTDHNFLAVTNNEDLLNSILQVQ